MAHSTAAVPVGALEQGCPIRVEHDRRRRQFTVRLNGCHDRAVLLYEYVGKRIVDLQHTEVPDAYRGRGIAKHLAKFPGSFSPTHPPVPPPGTRGSSPGPFGIRVEAGAQSSRAKAVSEHTGSEHTKQIATCPVGVFETLAHLGRHSAGPLSTPEFSVIIGMVSLSATDCYIVHEIYNGENAQDQFEYELEQALEAQYKYIVIEPTRIGDETARWITVGNCLHKTTVLAGTACLFTPLALPLDYSHYISLPAGVLSLACCTLYGISWQFDPCCKYQVEYDAYKLSRLPLHTLTSSTPVVLVRKDDLHRKRLHNTIALAALVYCVKKIYELYAV
ncbi:Transmembrane protein 11 [Pteropus alecto]|nr:Transmembrane protein 11 [Pteropus alecto]